MPGQRYEFRVKGRLSVRARDAFAGMEVAEIPAGTVISGPVEDNEQVHDVLALIQSLGLQVISMQRMPHEDRPQPSA